VEWISSRIVWRFGAEKISRDRRLVIRRVLEGGVGCVRGGRVDRSSDNGVRTPEERRDWRGENSGDGDVAILVLVVCFFSVRGL